MLSRAEVIGLGEGPQVERTEEAREGGSGGGVASSRRRGEGKWCKRGAKERRNRGGESERKERCYGGIQAETSGMKTEGNLNIWLPFCLWHRNPSQRKWQPNEAKSDQLQV